MLKALFFVGTGEITWFFLWITHKVMKLNIKQHMQNGKVFIFKSLRLWWRDSTNISCTCNMYYNVPKRLRDEAAASYNPLEVCGGALSLQTPSSALHCKVWGGEQVNTSQSQDWEELISSNQRVLPVVCNLRCNAQNWLLSVVLRLRTQLLLLRSTFKWFFVKYLFTLTLWHSTVSLELYGKFLEKSLSEHTASRHKETICSSFWAVSCWQVFALSYRSFTECIPHAWHEKGRLDTLLTAFFISVSASSRLSLTNRNSEHQPLRVLSNQTSCCVWSYLNYICIFFSANEIKTLCCEFCISSMCICKKTSSSSPETFRIYVFWAKSYTTNWWTLQLLHHLSLTELFRQKWDYFTGTSSNFKQILAFYSRKK